MAAPEGVTLHADFIGLVIRTDNIVEIIYSVRGNIVDFEINDDYNINNWIRKRALEVQKCYRVSS